MAKQVSDVVTQDADGKVDAAAMEALITNLTGPAQEEAKAAEAATTATPAEVGVMEVEAAAKAE